MTRRTVIENWRTLLARAWRMARVIFPDGRVCREAKEAVDHRRSMNCVDGVDD
jgi:hypothetical protein